MANAKTPQSNDEERGKAKKIPISGSDEDSVKDTKTDASEESSSSIVDEAEEILAAESEESDSAEKQKSSDDGGDDETREPAQAEDEQSDAGAEDETSAEEISVEELLEQAKAEAADWQDKFMRLHAEWDTYRRRMNEQREAEKLRANEKLVTGILPVLDDFERTIAYASENGTTGLLEGVQAIQAKLNDILASHGVEIIDPAGEAFDALEAQAVATVENTEVPDETVNEVYQKGYRMGTKVLRPAMVTVTTGGPKREAPQDDEDGKD